MPLFTTNDFELAIKIHYPDTRAWIHGPMSNALVAALVPHWLAFFKTHIELMPAELHDEIISLTDEDLAHMKMVALLRSSGRLEGKVFTDNQRGHKFAADGQDTCQHYLTSKGVSKPKAVTLSRAITDIESPETINRSVLSNILGHITTLLSLRVSGKNFPMYFLPSWHLVQTDLQENAFFSIIKHTMNIVRVLYSGIGSSLSLGDVKIVEPLTNERQACYKTHIEQLNVDPNVFAHTQEHVNRYFSSMNSSADRDALGRRVKAVKRLVRSTQKPEDTPYLNALHLSPETISRTRTTVSDRLSTHAIEDADENGFVEAALIAKLLGNQYLVAYSAQRTWSLILGMFIKIVLESRHGSSGPSVKHNRYNKKVTFRQGINIAQRTQNPDELIGLLSIAAVVNPFIKHGTASPDYYFAHPEHRSAIGNTLDSQSQQIVITTNLLKKLFGGEQLILLIWLAHQVYDITQKDSLPPYCLVSLYFDLNKSPIAEQIAITKRVGRHTHHDVPNSVRLSNILRHYRDGNSAVQVRVDARNVVQIRHYPEGSRPAFLNVKKKLHALLATYHEIAGQLEHCLASPITPTIKELLPKANTPPSDSTLSRSLFLILETLKHNALNRTDYNATLIVQALKKIFSLYPEKKIAAYLAMQLRTHKIATLRPWFLALTGYFKYYSPTKLLSCHIKLFLYIGEIRPEDEAYFQSCFSIGLDHRNEISLTISEFIDIASRLLSTGISHEKIAMLADLFACTHASLEQFKACLKTVLLFDFPIRNIAAMTPHQHTECSKRLLAYLSSFFYISNMTGLYQATIEMINNHHINLLDLTSAAGTILLTWLNECSLGLLINQTVDIEKLTPSNFKAILDTAPKLSCRYWIGLNQRILSSPVLMRSQCLRLSLRKPLIAPEESFDTTTMHLLLKMLNTASSRETQYPGTFLGYFNSLSLLLNQLESATTSTVDLSKQLRYILLHAWTKHLINLLPKKRKLLYLTLLGGYAIAQNEESMQFFLTCYFKGIIKISVKTKATHRIKTAIKTAHTTQTVFAFLQPELSSLIKEYKSAQKRIRAENNNSDPKAGSGASLGPRLQ